MRYLRAVQYPFDNPNWPLNLAFAALCLFIPILGPIVLIGYEFEVIEALLRTRNDRTYPDFKTDRISIYFKRGLPPFVVALLLGFVASFVSLPFVVLTYLVPDSPVLLFLIGLIGLAAVMVVTFGLFFAKVPLYLRAGFAQDFGGLINVEFVRDFVQRMWRELALSVLFLFALGIVANVGFCVCFVGILATAALVTFAQHHLYYQLYELYLQRGGVQVPLKTPAA